MTIRPILFSGPMVRALLDGRKTQTRRIIKDQATNSEPIGGATCDPLGLPERPYCWLNGYDGSIVRPIINPPSFLPGDLLYVRESWSGHHTFRNCPPAKRQSFLSPEGFFHRDEIWFWADGSPEFGDWERPRPGIHMPRWASRLTLKVTDVRVQRLQEISEDDAESEGAAHCDRCNDVGWINSGPDGGWQCDAPGCGDAYADHFQRLWDSLNEKRGFGWQANPWVVALTFEVHKCNVDSFEKEKAA